MVSIVIATYNEEKNITLLLKSCLAQTYPKIEIIVVDSQRTTDATVEIAKKYVHKIYKFGAERSMQRNYGVDKAKGEYVFILDADMVLDSEVVASCINIFQTKPKVGGIIIPEISFGEGYWAKCKALERNCYIGDSTIEAARFFRKTLFVKVSGYAVNMISGEDWDLHNKIKEVALIDRTAKFIYHNEGRLNLVKYLKKKIYYAQKSDSYIQNNVSGFNQVLVFFFRPAYFRNWKVLLSDPIHFLGFVIMKILEFLVGTFIIVSKPVFWRKMFGK